MSAKGTFITFEGGEGCGKSTHIKLLTSRLEELGYTVCQVREPGGTASGERIREILLDPSLSDMEPLTELLLYEAARAQIVTEVISPALQDGQVVLCDRFIDSTVAYQGYGRGLDVALIEELNAATIVDCVPDRTILLQLDAQAGLQRAIEQTGEAHADRIEAAGADFHERVHAGFDELAAQDPQRIRLIQTAPSREKTQEAIRAQLADLFEGL